MKNILIYDPNLPFDGTRPDTAALSALSGFFDIVGTEGEIPEGCATIVNLHGQYFPERLWSGIKRELLKGCGLINAGGGSPFSLPVSVKDGGLHTGRHMTGYHRQLSIHNCLDIKADRYSALAIPEQLPLLEGYSDCFTVSDTVGFIVQFTHAKDVPHEGGTSGPVDASIQPLLKGLDSDGRHTASPVVLIEHVKGDYCGGRHIFINQQITQAFWTKGTKLLAELATFAAQGSFEVTVRTNYALYYENERPMMLLSAQNFGRSRSAQLSYKIIKDDKALLSDTLSLGFTGDIAYLSVPLNLDISGGLYEVRTELTVEGEPARRYSNGFWGHDAALLESVKAPSCDKDYFYIDGKTQPIAGMTYMQPDLHRKFLFLPNPMLWDADFAEFKRAGINMVRTGIWTAYRHMSFIDGYTDEGVLRAFEAMAHTASRYGIPLVFNFFAFTPERWEGINAYLDPRSRQAQKRFITSFISRLKTAGAVMWDLINEPSVLNHNRLWQTRPNADRFELAAWRDWLRAKHGTIEKLRESWGLPVDAISSFDSIGLPGDEIFTDNPTFAQYVNALSSPDYYLFAQDMFTKWAAEMTAAIKAAGSGALVTVGQDESIHPRRPNPLLHKDAVDYVCVHTWWLMDSLFYDGVTAKPLDKPCLVQETGIMYVSDPDTRIRRDLEELRDILERKYALALGSGCAGAVHWLWNTNCQMDDVNEAHIGALFADGAHKHEADVSYLFGSFAAKTAGLYNNRKREEIAVVFPFSNLFSSRNFAVPAINNLCRIMGYEFNTHFDLVSEYETDKCSDYKLIILPSPRTLTQKAWDSLVKAVENGSTLVVTGPFWDNEYFMPIKERAALLGVEAQGRNTAREEQVVLDGISYNCAFGGDGLAWIDRGDTPDGSGVMSVSVGKGKITWCALPLEVCANAGLMKSLYGGEMEKAGIVSDFTWQGTKAPGVFLRRLDFDEASLYIAVSESGSDSAVSVKDNKHFCTLSFALESQRAAMFMVSHDGTLIASYRDVKINIEQQ